MIFPYPVIDDIIHTSTRFSALEHEGEERRNELRQLQEQISASAVTTEWLKDENKKLRLECETLEKKASQSLDELTGLRKEFEARTEK